MATSSATVRSLNSGNRAAWVSEELEAMHSTAAATPDRHPTGPG